MQVFRQAGIASVTVATMEVPCCSGLAGMVQKAMEASGKTVALREVVTSTTGGIVSDTGQRDPAEKRSASGS
ncbi:MAG: hypothetical protein R6X08_10160 [Desulfosalsimonadaceae bacterium]